MVSTSLHFLVVGCLFALLVLARVCNANFKGEQSPRKSDSAYRPIDMIVLGSPSLAKHEKATRGEESTWRGEEECARKSEKGTKNCGAKGAKKCRREGTKLDTAGLKALERDIPDSCRHAWIILGPLLTRAALKKKPSP